MEQEALNDFEYDVLCKKRIANQAKYKRSHCGKNGMTMSTDNMTRKQLQAMNGEVKTYQLNKPMLWHTFLSMPSDLKNRYIDILRDNGCPSLGAAAEMFGVTVNSLRNKLEDVPRLATLMRGSGVRPSMLEVERWEIWLGGGLTDDGKVYEQPEKSLEKVDETVEKSPKKAVCEEQKPRSPFAMYSASASFRGKYNQQYIDQFIRLTAGDRDVTITITIEEGS